MHVSNVAFCVRFLFCAFVVWNTSLPSRPGFDSRQMHVSNVAFCVRFLFCAFVVCNTSLPSRCLGSARRPDRGPVARSACGASGPIGGPRWRGRGGPHG
eukprot:284816477_3